MEGGAEARERLRQLMASLSCDFESMKESTAHSVPSEDSIEVLRKSVVRHSPSTHNVKDFFRELNLTPILPSGYTVAPTIGPVMTSTPCLPSPHLATGNKQTGLHSYYRLGKRSHKQKTNRVTESETKLDSTARKQFRNMLRKAPSKVQSASHWLRKSKSSKVKVQAKATPTSPPLCILVQQQCTKSKEVNRRYQFAHAYEDEDIPEDILTQL